MNVVEPVSIFWRINIVEPEKNVVISPMALTPMKSSPPQTLTARTFRS